MEIVRTANLFSSYILVEVSGTQRNAKSLLSMSALKGFRGPVVVMVVGADSREALGTLSNNFIEMQKRTT
ncbi:HPr family phosphocarrier protein [Alkalihalobacillus sp. R86527]|uniref:HPr family phosphocarrier protein n=1 Tax=Alkalihalobacillus sp. R86527 TaxID=3093863 RepID=UPI00366BACAF